MPTFESHRLLEELTATVKQGMEEIQPLYDCSTAALQQRPADGGWSVAEVLFHLNYYADYYTEAMETAMTTTPSRRTSSFKSGWLGNYFTNIIGPRDEEGKLPMKMQSPPGAVPPAASKLNPQQELDTYMAHQRKLLKLLHQANSSDLAGIRVPITLSKWIRLKLGDTFRFVVAHQERHHQQIGALVPLAKVNG